MTVYSKYFFLVLLGLFSIESRAQLIQHSIGGDSTKTVSLEGYADIYFGYDFNEPSDKNRPYFVSHSRHNEFNINLAYLSLKYSSERARACFTPGFGTYMNANYATEPGSLQFLVEANIGLKPFKRKEIWIDAGVFVAPYTTETAITHDQLLYTRSLGADFSPYYLTGLRAAIPIARSINLYLYLVNGWQVIQDVNNALSVATALEWKLSKSLTFNWSTYFGDERTAQHSDYKSRIFSDLNCLYQPNKRLSLSLDLYGGLQDRDEPNDASGWYQWNLNGRFFITSNHSLGARVEYFRDANTIVAIPVTAATRFDCASASLGYSLIITENVSVHAEGRYFFSDEDIFLNPEGQPSKQDALLIGGITAKF